MALQEGDALRLQCEDCYRPLGRFVLYQHRGDGPLLLAPSGVQVRKRSPTTAERAGGVRGHRRGRVWAHDEGDGVRYRYECRCGRTILLGTARVQRFARSYLGQPSDAVFLV